MLSFFRVNDPYRLVFIFLILVGIRFAQSYFISEIPYEGLKWLLMGEWLAMGFTLYSETFDFISPLSAGIYKWLHIFLGRSPLQFYVISTLLIVVQAAIFNLTLMRNKVFEENGYLPAFLYATTMAAVPDFMMLSPQLMSLTFVLLALRSIMRRINNQINDSIFIDAGIFIGIATILYFPSFIFLLVYLVSLILFSSTILRRILLYFVSILLVWVFAYLWYYYQSVSDLLLAYGVAGSLNGSSVQEWKELLMGNFPIFIVFIISLIRAIQRATLNNFQVKIQQTSFLFLVGSLVIFAIAKDRSSYVLVFMVPIFAYYQSYYFMLLERRVFKVVAPFILIVSPLIFTCYHYSAKKIHTYQPALTQSGLMILGEDLEYYRDQEIKTPCFDQEISKKAFEGLDYFKSSARIYDIIHQVDPNGLYDQLDVADKLFYRFPTVSERYRPAGANLYVKVSN